MFKQLAEQIGQIQIQKTKQKQKQEQIQVQKTTYKVKEASKLPRFFDKLKEKYGIHSDESLKDPEIVKYHVLTTRHLFYYDIAYVLKYGDMEAKKVLIERLYYEYKDDYLVYNILLKHEDLRKEFECIFKRILRRREEWNKYLEGRRR